MKLSLSHINFKTVAAWIFLPTVLVVAYYVIIATQKNLFEFTLENQTMKNKFVDEIVIPNTGSQIEFGDKIITKSILAYLKMIRFLTKEGIAYKVRRITEGEYKTLTATI